MDKWVQEQSNPFRTATLPPCDFLQRLTWGEGRPDTPAVRPLIELQLREENECSARDETKSMVSSFKTLDQLIICKPTTSSSNTVFREQLLNEEGYSHNSTKHGFFSRDASKYVFVDPERSRSKFDQIVSGDVIFKSSGGRRRPKCIWNYASWQADHSDITRIALHRSVTSCKKRKTHVTSYDLKYPWATG